MSISPALKIIYIHLVIKVKMIINIYIFNTFHTSHFENHLIHAVIQVKMIMNIFTILNIVYLYRSENHLDSFYNQNENDNEYSHFKHMSSLSLWNSVLALETGCLKLAVVKFLGVQILRGITIYSYFYCPSESTE